jgi:hypothetical protein
MALLGSRHHGWIPNELQRDLVTETTRTGIRAAGATIGKEIKHFSGTDPALTSAAGRRLTRDT